MDTYGHVPESGEPALVGAHANFELRNLKRAGGEPSRGASLRVGKMKGENRDSGQELRSNRVERRGIEPRFAECDSAVIPLDHRPGTFFVEPHSMTRPGRIKVARVTSHRNPASEIGYGDFDRSTNRNI